MRAFKLRKKAMVINQLINIRAWILLGVSSQYCILATMHSKATETWLEQPCHWPPQGKQV